MESHICLEPAQNQVKYDVGKNSSLFSYTATQIFVGGLDPSVDKETLVKLFGMVPNMVSLDMDMDGNNNFRVLLYWLDHLQGTAVVVYKTRTDAEAAVARFDNQELAYNNLSMNMRVRMLGSVINVSGETPSKEPNGFFRAAMDNPE